jgi:hypothetical protein
VLNANGSRRATTQSTTPTTPAHSPWTQLTPQTGLENDFARIKGITVEAILGGVFLQHGSPAAQRVFHSQILPAFAAQLRDPALQEAAKLASESAEAIGTISQ